MCPAEERGSQDETVSVASRRASGAGCRVPVSLSIPACVRKMLSRRSEGGLLLTSSSVAAKDFGAACPGEYGIDRGGREIHGTQLGLDD